MFSLTLRDHIMVAHSFKSPVFGAARALHGATFVVDVTFFTPTLTGENIVLDIGRAHNALKEILAPITYKNLDDHPQMQGQETTTEFLCAYIFAKLCAALKDGALGAGSHTIKRIKVALAESHIASAAYESDV